MAVPQLSIGTIFGTSFAFRYLPNIELNDEIGKLEYFGFSVQHNPSVWFPLGQVVDVSAAFFTQKLKVGTLLEANATHLGVQVSKSFGPGALSLTPYLGLGWETSDMKFTYNFSSEDPFTGGVLSVPVEFELDGDNTYRVTAGVGVRLGILNVNADYNLGNTKTATAGLMLVL